MNDIPDYVPPTVSERVRKLRATRREKAARLRTPEAEAAMREALITGHGYAELPRRFGVSWGYVSGWRTRVLAQMAAEARAAQTIDHAFGDAERAALIAGGFAS